MKNIVLVVLFGSFVQVQVSSCLCAEGNPQFKFSGGDQPIASFSVSQEVFCVGNCALFVDESESDIPIVEWEWTFQGGQATGETDQGISSQQNPEVCYETPGAYWAVLSVTDMNGVTSIPDSILILVDPCTGPLQVNFGVSDTSICAGDCIDFQNQSLGFQTNYTWIFGGINQTSSEENPAGICYNTPGTYDVTLIVENGIEAPNQLVKTDFIMVENCINPPVPMISVSQDTICIGQCVDFFDESTGLGSQFFQYEWLFDGAANGSEISTDADPEQICYETAGSFNVVLTVKRLSIPDSATQVFTNAVTVLDTLNCPNLSAISQDGPNKSLHVFPNPANESITIDLESYNTEAYSLAIYSIDGRLIHSLRENTNLIVLNLSDYSNGAYILNLLDNSGNPIAQSKLIIQ
ncbi:MAG TPA: PKD domain-containing protein [Cryomorphaceae bacterium]|nr:PKD domain-containing protein [Cryomorphaceae bacterium]